MKDGYSKRKLTIYRKLTVTERWDCLMHFQQCNPLNEFYHHAKHNILIVLLLILSGSGFLSTIIHSWSKERTCSLWGSFKEMDTLAREKTLSKIILSPLSRRCLSRIKYFHFKDPFLEGLSIQETKQTESRKSYHCKSRWKINQVYPYH